MSKEAALALLNVKPTTTPPAVVGEPGSTPAPEAKVESNDELVSTRIAKIAKKEAEYQAEREKIKKEHEDLQKQRGEFEPFFKRYKEFEELKSKDPVAAIRLLGLSDADFVNFMTASEDKSTPEEKAAKIATAEIEKFKKGMEEKEAQVAAERDKEAIAQLQKNIGITIKTDADKFEFCNFYGESAQHLIYQTIVNAFQEDVKGNPDAEPMTAEAAADLVEKYYEEQATEMVSKLKKLKKEPPTEVISPVKELKRETIVSPPPKAEERPAVKTLTNRMTPTAAAAAGTSTKVETRAEKRERLMNALRNLGKA